MGDEANRENLQQQPSDDQRRQADQQNQQGQPRREGQDVEGVEGEGVDTFDVLEGGVDTGAIQPGNTGQR